MQKQKFDPEAHSVSLEFGRHIVHGHDQDSAFGDILQKMLLNEVTSSCDEAFSKAVGDVPEIDFNFVEGDSVLNTFRQWLSLVENEHKPVPEFTPCSVPDWMRSKLRSNGMSDSEIDSLLIVGIDPMLELGPGVVLTVENI